ncbi:MAG: ABC transporter substrate-binding protein [Acidimicrobiales bacterium]
MKRSYAKLLTVVFAFALIAAACGDSNGDSTESGGDAATTEAPTTEAPTTEAPTTEAPTTEAPETTEPMDEGDLAGTTVSVFGPESSDEEAGGVQDALDVFAEETGITIEYTGARDFSDQINAQAVGGNPPDIAIFPQPGKVADFAREGLVLPLPDEVTAASNENWPADWNNFGVVDGVQYAVPNKADLKSLVWYQPSRFEALGYEVPQTYDEFVALVATAAADGNTPLCVGIESGPATGWVFTDWVEEMMLRFAGGDVYDQWVANEIPFDDPAVVSAMQQVIDLWNSDGAVFAAGGSIAATPFGDNGQPLVDGDCLMHRQASFFAAFIPEGTAFADGSEGAVDVFYFPSNEGKPILVAGTVASAFRDAPEVWAVMEYFSSAEYANARQAAQTERKGGGLSGFLSAANGVDSSLYQGLEKSFIDIMLNADVARFDASDLMPAAVGAGTFWTEGTSIVNGDVSVEEGAANIQASWPS